MQNFMGKDEVTVRAFSAIALAIRAAHKWPSKQKKRKSNAHQASILLPTL